MNLIIFSFLFSMGFAGQDCRDYSGVAKGSSLLYVKRAREVKNQMDLLQYQFALCREKLVPFYSDKTFYRQTPLYFKEFTFMSVKVSKEGQLSGECDCERNVMSSLDIHEAKYKLELGKCYGEVLEKAKISKSTVALEPLCWSGSSKSLSASAPPASSAPTAPTIPTTLNEGTR